MSPSSDAFSDSRFRNSSRRRSGHPLVSYTPDILDAHGIVQHELLAKLLRERGFERRCSSRMLVQPVNSCNASSRGRVSQASENWRKRSVVVPGTKSHSIGRCGSNPADLSFSSRSECKGQPDSSVRVPSGVRYRTHSRFGIRTRGIVHTEMTRSWVYFPP